MRPDARMRLRNMAVGVVASIGAVVVAAAMVSACAGSESVDTSTSGSSQSTTGTGARGGAGGESSSTTTSATNGSGGKGGAGASSGPGGNGGTAGSGVAGAGGATGGGGAGGDAGSGGNGGSGCQVMPEICNGLDDNCNNLVDEGDPGGGADCMAVALGECKKGKMHCVNGAPKCVPGQIVPEVCDGLDNNCDGNVDEGVSGTGQQCMTGLLGLCSSGITQCIGGSMICVPSVMPGQLSEACNGLDDDCDGLTDEAIAQVGQPCTAVGFSGICQFGTYSCPTQAPFQLTCDHPLPGTVQESCNGLDDDCNGQIDDPALLNNLPCTTAFPGVCAAGKTQCVGGSLLCNANIQPNTQTEICNSLDDNCNGQTDEMNPTPACSTQNPGASFVSTWACNSGQCAIVTCQSGHANINGAIGDGCECSTDVWANSCNTASSLSVPKAGNVVMTGKIETATGSDWVVFSFVPPAGPPASYHPQVQLSNNAGGQYAMDVQTSCAVAVSCNDGGGGTNLTIWEQNYNGYGSVPTDQTTKILSVLVRVYRKNGDAPTCDQYTVTATNP